MTSLFFIAFVEDFLNCLCLSVASRRSSCPVKPFLRCCVSPVPVHSTWSIDSSIFLLGAYPISSTNASILISGHHRLHCIVSLSNSSTGYIHACPGVQDDHWQFNCKIALPPAASSAYECFASEQHKRKPLSDRFISVFSSCRRSTSRREWPKQSSHPSRATDCTLQAPRSFLDSLRLQ